MSNSIKDVAALLMYKGPDINEIIQEAVSAGAHYETEALAAGAVKLTVSSTTAYDLVIVDTYYYNSDNELTRQTLFVNGKEKVVFDKYQEAKDILVNMEKTKKIAV